MGRSPGRCRLRCRSRRRGVERALFVRRSVAALSPKCPLCPVAAGRQSEHAMLLVRPGQRAVLYFPSVPDYWHLPSTPPEVDARAIDRRVFESRDALVSAVEQDIRRSRRVAYVGESRPSGDNAPFGEANPTALIHQLDFAARGRHRSKWRVCAKQRVSAWPAIAPRTAAWAAGGGEYDIHLAFLAASRQNESDGTLTSIVAQNEHAGVLHYQHYDRSPPPTRRSFLIDAGARHRGYVSDITRTYAARAPGEFADAGPRARQAPAAPRERHSPGPTYLDLHERIQREVGELLVEFRLLTCSAETAFETRHHRCVSAARPRPPARAANPRRRRTSGDCGRASAAPAYVIHRCSLT